MCGQPEYRFVLQIIAGDHVVLKPVISHPDAHLLNQPLVHQRELLAGPGEILNQILKFLRQKFF